ncbi:hypothetical protein EIK77_000231 [Talaromyces pinophilus]|nr:hypothetical protein EIK77_000231 [Talaromyces pinophilus]
MFFTTICAQLLLQVPALIHHVEMAIDTDPYISGKLMKEQFDKLLLQPLLRLNQSEAITIMIVIDALDECEHGSDIRAILQLLPQVQKSKSIRLRIFLTSRPELAIRLGFNQDISYQDLVLHELPKPEIEHDIRVYLEDELSKIRDERSFSNDWPGNKAIKELVQMAVPLFIFAATACRFIKEGIHPKKRLQDFLQFQVTSSASQMGKLYLPVLNQLMGDKEDGPKELLEEFQDVVGVIILLATPLSVKSLARLLDLPEQTISELLDPLHSVLNIPSDKDAPIRILHLSFRDYLLTTESLFHIDEKKTHQKIALHCLRVMNTSLKHNICGLPSYGTQRNDIDSQAVNQNLSADLQYACQYWVYHLNQSEDRIAESQIFAFLKQHFLHWLEALSLMSVISEAVTMTDLLQSGGRNDTDSEFSYFLYDAKRFTLKNTYIASIAPLQLYCSGLVFSPMQSAIRRIFSDSRPKQLSILPQVEDYWNPGLQTLEGHSAQVSSIAFSPNGQTLASGSHDGTIKLWDTKTGSELQTLKGYSGWVHSISFSSDSQIVASSSGNCIIKLWDVKAGSELQILKGHSAGIHSITFSSKGQILASGSFDHTIKFWDIKTGSELRTLKGHSDWVLSIAFSSDGQILASGSSDHTIKLWCAKTGSELRTLEGHSAQVSSIAFSSNSQMVASGSGDRTIKLWDVKTGSELRTLKGHSDWVLSIAFSSDGQTMASGSDDHTIKLWDARTGSELQTLRGHSDSVSSIAFSSDSQMVASGSHDNTIKLWDAKASSKLHTLKGHSDRVWSMAFSSDSQMVASGSHDHTIKLWDAKTGSELRTFKGHSDRVSSVAFSLDGRMVASGSGDHTIKLWDAKTGYELRTLKGHSNLVSSIDFSSDSQTIVSGSTDRTVKFWDIKTGSELQTFKASSDWVSSISLDSQMVTSRSHDNTIELSDAKTSSKLQTLKGHLDRIWSKLWDAKTSSELQTLKGHSDLVSSITFSSDVRTVTSVSLSDNWVSLAGENLLWLPPEHRQFTASTVKEANLALGYSDGRVSIIGFHTP